MTRQDLLAALWNGRDPFAPPPTNPRPLDLQGWRSVHPTLHEAIATHRPEVIVEIGAWKGASTAYMARTLIELGLPGTVVAVDTWLGAVDHWSRADLFAELGCEHGYPTLYRTFLSNLVHEGLTGRVVPLPLDSVNAGKLMALRGIVADMIHLDAGHEEASVAADLAAWWPVLRPGGALVADDYDPDGGQFPGVMRAVDAFCAGHGLGRPRANRGKCLVLKPARA
jgi:predicted O-methyltransferase YrrM